jgi:hypothetical protein
MFYAPIIFKTISANGAMLSTVITGIINVLSTFVSIALVDRVGRKARPLAASCLAPSHTHQHLQLPYP